MPLASMPVDKASVLELIVSGLRAIPGMVAIVLGGSYAQGCARADSDLDIGLYYREASPFSMEGIRLVADEMSRPATAPTVTDLYEWGPWVNGGAWIETYAGKVDFLYRNLDHVQQVIQEGLQGICHHDYDQQPPYGFRSVVYFGETQICVPLHDPEGEIARLKDLVAEYPAPLRERIIQESLWGAEFSLMYFRSFAGAGDIYNAAGCMTRVAQYLIHALFALNRRYFVSDKDVTRLIEQFSMKPHHFLARLNGVLASPGKAPAELKRSAAALRGLWLETIGLTNGAYRPSFRLQR